jgi:hypothetical protein
MAQTGMVYLVNVKLDRTDRKGQTLAYFVVASLSVNEQERFKALTPEVFVKLMLR